MRNSDILLPIIILLILYFGSQVACKNNFENPFEKEIPIKNTGIVEEENKNDNTKNNVELNAINDDNIFQKIAPASNTNEYAEVSQEIDKLANYAELNNQHKLKMENVSSFLPDSSKLSSEQKKQMDDPHENMDVLLYQDNNKPISQTLRNASHDLRPEPKNPQIAVSLWNNSTIDPNVQNANLFAC